MNVYRILTVLISLSFLSSPLGFSQTVKLDKYKDTKQTITKVRIASASIMPVKWNKEKKLLISQNNLVKYSMNN